MASFVRSPAAVAAGVGLLVAVMVLSLAALRVGSTLAPERQVRNTLDFSSMRVAVEPVEFASADGLTLDGWLLPGDAGRAPLLLCHDLGSSRAAQFNLALLLNRNGFPVLLFDFRAHGTSDGRRSTLGMAEKRDVLGAVDWLEKRREFRRKPVGVYGVGMGAHAAVLAAAKRRSIRVLVLDGLYPDAAFPLMRGFYGGWESGARRLGAIPAGLYTAINGAAPSAERAADVLAALRGRDVLLLAPAGDTRLAAEIRTMYESIPLQPDVDGNMLVLPATQSEGLYGSHLERHHAGVLEFFSTRLPPG